MSEYDRNRNYNTLENYKVFNPSAWFDVDATSGI
jgi:hypothetical protein